MNKEEFIEEVKKLNIEVTEEKMELLDKFYHMLIEWNEKINLTTIVEEDKVSSDGYTRDLTAFDFLYTIRDMDIYNWYKHLFNDKFK